MNAPLDKLDVNNPANQQNEQKITLSVGIQESNTIKAALQEIPHRVADPILRNLIAQAQSQVQQPPGPRI